MKFFNCLLKNKSQKVISLFVAVCIFMSALFVGFAPNLFTVKANNDNPFVLKVAPNSTNMPFLGQWVSLEQGKTYIYSNCYLPDTIPYQYIYKNTNDGMITDYEVIDDTEWWRQGLKFTVPSDAMDDPNVAGNKLIWVGLRGYKMGSPLYYYDFKLVDADNPEVNLLKDADLTSNGANLDKTVWMSPYNTDIKSVLAKQLRTAGGIDVFKKSVKQEYAIRLEPNSTGWPVFGQNVSLKTGKTYIFSNYYLPATDPNQWICHGGNVDKGITFEIVDDAEWSKQGAKFTVPEDAPDDPNVAGNKLIWVGFRGHKNANPLYYYGLDLHDIENPSVNLLKDADLSGGGAQIKADTWKAPSGNFVSSKFSKVKLDSIGGIDTFRKQVSSEPMALKLEPNSTGMPWFGQWVALERGKTYIFSNCYLAGTDMIHRIYYKHDNGEYDLSDIEGETVSDSLWSRFGTKFTVPADAPDNGGGKTNIWVGFRGYKIDKPLYFYDFDLYDIEKPDVNLLLDGDLLVNGLVLNKVVWKTPGGDVKSVFSKVTLASIGGEDIFKIEQPEGTLALKLEAGISGQPFFGQNVSLKAGKTYIFSNYYLPFTPSNQFVCYYGSEDAVKTEVIDDIEWSNRGLMFTVPEDAQDDPNVEGNKLLWVGFRGNKANDPLYYYDLRLYDIEDPNVNLLKDADFKENGWYFNNNVWVSPYGKINKAYSKVELNSVGGIDIFKNPMADEPMALVLAPETTGMPFFGQWVTLEKGKTYIFSNCYLPGTDTVQNVFVDTKGTELKDYDVTYDSKWSKRNMKFTVPSDLPDNGKGKVSLWVGIRGYKYDDYLYYYNFELYDIEHPEVNLYRDSQLRENDTLFNNNLWLSPYNTALKTTFEKVPLELLGGEDVFKRTGDTGPKMLYYIRNSRGPNHETYGSFAISIPEGLRVPGKNYVLQFDARSIKGIGLNNFRCGTIDPALRLDENNTIAPASIDGYTYKFNLRFSNEDMTKKPSIMIFVPEGAEGYISNIYMYEADENFNKISDKDLFNNSYSDFSHYELGKYVEFYALMGGCIGTETGKLVSVPEYFFNIAPNVPVPAGDKMMSYASVWGAGTVIIKLPHTAKKGSIDGKNYVVSLNIRPTNGRDPSKFHSTGINGEHVQVYPTKVEGYKYTFNLSERYDFSLVLEFPIDCEGYISNLEMYEADMDFKPINNVNLATAFGKDGKFADTTIQQGMEWEEIEFKGGFVNTFIDTRALEKELKSGTLGSYGSTGGIWPIPQNYFVADVDEGWADAYASDTETGSGKIIGKIMNTSGTAFTDCKVLLRSMQDSDYVIKATPNKNGEFTCDSVPVGGYEVSIILDDGSEVLGNMFAWVEENNDTVLLTLTYDDSGLSMSFPEEDYEDYTEYFPEDNGEYTEEEYFDENTDDFIDYDSEENNTQENNNASQKTPAENNNILIWVLSGAGAFIIVGLGLFVVLFIKKKSKKTSK